MTDFRLGDPVLTEDGPGVVCGFVFIDFKRFIVVHPGGAFGEDQLRSLFCDSCSGVLPPFPKGYSRPFCQRPDHWEAQGIEPPIDYDGSGMYRMEQPPRPERTESYTERRNRHGRWNAPR